MTTATKTRCAIVEGQTGHGRARIAELGLLRRRQCARCTRSRSDTRGSEAYSTALFGRDLAWDQRIHWIVSVLMIQDVDCSAHRETVVATHGLDTADTLSLDKRRTGHG